MRIKNATISAALFALLCACQPKLQGDLSTRAPLAAEVPNQAPGASSKDQLKGWVPSEHKGKWKDPGVYVDGKLYGILAFDELPRHMPVFWKEIVVMLPFKPGHKGPRQKRERARRYRVADYLRSVGVDINVVKELHMYGGRDVVALVSGDELRRVQDDLLFSFSADTFGKAKIWFPSQIATNTSFDRIRGFSVYIDKKPPVLDPELQILVMNGKPIEGVPYYGTPARGGVRVYLDGKLLKVIKRRKLGQEGQIASTEPNQAPRWNLLSYLSESQLGDSKIVGVELVDNNRKRVPLKGQDFQSLSFSANPQAGGEVFVQHGQESVTTKTIHLFTKWPSPLALR